MSKIPTKIIDDLNKICEKFGYSQNQVASKVGISSSVVSQIFSGDYDYIPENHVWLQIEKFIDRAGMKIYDTKLMKVISKMLDVSYKEKKLSVIVSESGAGKTTAVEQYCLLNPNAIHIRVMEVFTKKYLLERILKACNSDYEGMRTQTLFDSVSELLSRRQRLIVIDEAERLSFSELEMMRDLFDQGNGGLVLAGLPKLLQLLKKGKNLRENPVQLYSRVNHQRVVDILEASDVQMIFKDKLDDFKISISADKYKQVARNLIHHGGLRAVINLAKDTIAPLAQKNEIKIIDDDFIDECLKRYSA